jgi:hypothetical protein
MGMQIDLVSPALVPTRAVEASLRGLSWQKIVQAFWKSARVSLEPEVILREILINIKLARQSKPEEIDIE